MLKLRYWPTSTNFCNRLVQIIDTESKSVFNGYLYAKDWHLMVSNLKFDEVVEMPVTSSRKNAFNTLYDWCQENDYVPYQNMGFFIKAISFNKEGVKND